MELEKFYPSEIFKFCPSCASEKFEPKSWHSSYCKNCGFVFYFNNAAAVAALIFNKNGELLFTKRKFEPKAGTLDLPGGFVDPLESAEQALVRELKEELDLKITQFQFMASFPNRYLYKGIVYFTCDLAFICKAETLDKISINDDVSGYVFLNPKILDFSLIGLDSIKKMIEYYNSCHAQD